MAMITSKNAFDLVLDADLIAIKMLCWVRYNFSNTGQHSNINSSNVNSNSNSSIHSVHRYAAS